MYTHRLAAQEFACVLDDPDLRIISKEGYVSRTFGWPGVKWEAELNGRPIYGSENRTTVPTHPSELAKILRSHDCRIDTSKDALYYAPRRGGPGMRVEFHFRGRWYQVWIPDL